MRKKLYLNSCMSLIYQIATVIVGLILPRITLSTYGSDTNGLISSITQMLGFISFLELGIGAIVQTSLYKPLTMRDTTQISLIFASAQEYFRKIAWVLLLYVVGLCFYYGIFRSKDFAWSYTTVLIIAISINSFAQYYFGLCNTLLLNADQKIYVATLINLVTLVINAIATIAMMKLGFSIQLVKLATSLIFLSRPIFLHQYVKRHYQIAKIRKPPEGVLKDKWSGVTQHVSAVLTGSIDYIVLTLLSSFQNVSIYSVYVMPLNSIRNLILTVSSGYKSYFGNLIARNNYDELLQEFNKYEFMSHYVVAVLFGCSSVAIVPFINVYTHGINDADYIDFTFALLITIAYSVFSLQTPYTSVIFSAGHFRRTQSFCLWECVVNIIISVALVRIIGISGVAIGTIAAVLYRMVASVLYLRKNILFRGFKRFALLIIADILSIFSIYFPFAFFRYTCETYLQWTMYSALVFLFSIVVVSIFYKIFFPKEFQIKKLCHKIITRVRSVIVS